MFKHNRMAGDVPAGIEPHAAFGVGQNFHPLGVKRIEAGIGQNTPVRGLQVVQTIELAFVLEIAGGIGERLETMEEIAQASFQLLLELRTKTAQQIALLGIEAGKGKAITQAARLCAFRLIRWRIVPQNSVPDNVPAWPELNEKTSVSSLPACPSPLLRASLTKDEPAETRRTVELRSGLTFQPSSFSQCHDGYRIETGTTSAASCLTVGRTSGHFAVCFHMYG
jgi:hypothetical protein